MTDSLRTGRLLLRRWLPRDREPFAAMNADPRVMEHFPVPLTRAESDQFADRVEQHFAAHGFGPWAVEIPGAARFAGFVGLAVPRFDAPFMPCVEVGWRLCAAHWGRGYATEAARAVLADAFDRLRLPEVVSFTSATNERSVRVMQRLGMARDLAGDFEHPSLPVSHRLRRHVLYRMQASAWRQAGGSRAAAARGPVA
jgi:ribosomal-protein-alanine N-acetyltransferase